MNIKNFVYLSLIFISISPISPVAAGELSILVNGIALHSEKPAGPELNERNWGTGLQYDFNKTRGNWVPFVAASGFLDSFKNPSYYLGGGALRRWQLTKKYHFDAGVIAFFMTRQDYLNGNPFPGILPAFSFGNERLSLNVTYVPKIDPKLIELWFFQLKIAVSKGS